MSEEYARKVDLLLSYGWIFIEERNCWEKDTERLGNEMVERISVSNLDRFLSI
ncbi:MAG TPA: hypothetical protein VK190_03480 [Pseudoneobacillus sp.]|nr:hypothetical protein [Pseudoneobacillus sp.]